MSNKHLESHSSHQFLILLTIFVPYSLSLLAKNLGVIPIPIPLTLCITPLPNPVSFAFRTYPQADTFSPPPLLQPQAKPLSSGVGLFQ
jgi:hypothetical protein